MPGPDGTLRVAMEWVRAALPDMRSTVDHTLFTSTLTTYIAPAVSVCTCVYDPPDDGVTVLVVAHGHGIVIPVHAERTLDSIFDAHMCVVRIVRAIECDPRDPVGTEQRILDAYDAAHTE